MKLKLIPSNETNCSNESKTHSAQKIQKGALRLVDILLQGHFSWSKFRKGHFSWSKIQKTHGATARIFAAGAVSAQGQFRRRGFGRVSAQGFRGEGSGVTARVSGEGFSARRGFAARA
ncbi:hypothetical protein Salat_0521100 [Sesamum alatum]|uniref:Uncharacterized protein n=1 Tax=Sesamum alatum TaxID=300844 RepID=A0AAE2D105_9LAMI|nr:hypothetical protein Salat_0521100 [Sesamum alatum]